MTIPSNYRRWLYSASPLILIGLCAVIYGSYAHQFFGTEHDVQDSVRLTSQLSGSQKSVAHKEPLSEAPVAASLNPTTSSSKNLVSNLSSTPVSRTQTAPACSLNLSDALKTYSTELRKQKSVLDTQLSFPPVGATISLEFITEYNDTIKKLYESYVQKAVASNCTFPTSAPVYLPDNYRN